MKKSYKEIIHYIILSILITITIFIAHSLSGFLEKMTTSTLQTLVTIGWILLFLWYLIFIGIVLILSDKILHKILRI